MCEAFRKKHFMILTIIKNGSDLKPMMMIL